VGTVDGAETNTTMQRRKYLAALGSLAAGGAAMTGTSAFTSTAADRNVSMDVAGDGSAFLQLTPGDSPYAYTEGGELVLDFDGSEVSGSGLNTSAFVKFNELFSVQNSGPEPVAVWLDEGNSGAPDVNNGASANFADASGIPGYALFWSFSRDSQSSYYANAGYGYIGNQSYDPSTDPHPTDTADNDLEYGLDDPLLAPVNVPIDGTGVFDRTAQHPAVLTPGDSISIDFQVNTNIQAGGGIDPDDVDDFTGNVVVNAFSEDFAAGLQG
jgi:hypothetical protein